MSQIKFTMNESAVFYRRILPISLSFTVSHKLKTNRLYRFTSTTSNLFSNFLRQLLYSVLLFTGDSFPPTESAFWTSLQKRKTHSTLMTLFDVNPPSISYQLNNCHTYWYFSNRAVVMTKTRNVAILTWNHKYNWKVFLKHLLQSIPDFTDEKW